jgi:hypothetical protein
MLHSNMLLKYFMKLRLRQYKKQALPCKFEIVSEFPIEWYRNQSIWSTLKEVDLK